MRIRSAVLGIVFSTVLSGCAGNAIRVQRAGEMAAAGDAASAETVKFVGTVRATRRDANVALVASDPSCKWGPSIIIMGDNGVSPLEATSAGGKAAKPPPPQPLCTAPPVNAARGDFVYKLSADYHAAERAVELASALAAYSAAVGAIVAGDEIDARDSLQQAFGIVSALQTDIAAIAGAKALIDEEQTAAIGKLVGLLNELNVEGLKVKQLRLLVKSQKQPADQLAGELRGQVDILQSQWRGDLQVTSDAYRRALTLAEAQGGAKFSERRELIGKMASAEAQARDTAAFATALQQLIDQVAVAHTNFLATLDGNYSEKDRREMAYITRDRLLRAINSFAAIVAAF